MSDNEQMITAAQAKRLADAAYEEGWHDHFLERQRQELDPSYPIGKGKRGKTIAASLDPHGILGVGRCVAATE